MSTLFNQLDTVQQREAYINARKLSETTNMPVILHCRTLGGALSYSFVTTWAHWKSMEVCRFRSGVLV